MSKKSVQTHLTIAARFQKGSVYLGALIVESIHSLLKLALIYMIIRTGADAGMVDVLISLVSKPL